MSDPLPVETPPAFQPADAIQLNSVQDSKIIGVSVYAGRAEVTRLFKFNVQTGQNQVIVNGLPSVLDQDSLRSVLVVPNREPSCMMPPRLFCRVEGRGAATIHDVTISNIPTPAPPTTSLALDALMHKKDLALKAQERCQKSRASLKSYLDSLRVQHISMSQLGQSVDDYDATAEKLDLRALDLQKQLKDIDKEAAVERAKLTESNFNEKLSLRAAIGLFVESGDEVEMALIYGELRSPLNMSSASRLSSSCKRRLLERGVRYTRRYAGQR